MEDQCLHTLYKDGEVKVPGQSLGEDSCVWGILEQPQTKSKRLRNLQNKDSSTIIQIIYFTVILYTTIMSNLIY